jgi:hypothetical protein
VTVATPTPSDERPAAAIAPVLRIAAVVLLRPRLWLAGIRAGMHLAPRRWWARPPFLPLPDRDYWHFRMVTMFGGDGEGSLTTEQIVDYLHWSASLDARR